MYIEIKLGEKTLVIIIYWALSLKGRNDQDIQIVYQTRFNLSELQNEHRKKFLQFLSPICRKEKEARRPSKTRSVVATNTTHQA